jgi:hypothetical protein
MEGKSKGEGRPLEVVHSFVSPTRLTTHSTRQRLKDIIQR